MNNTPVQKKPFDVSVFDISLKVFRISDILTIMHPPAIEWQQPSVHTHFTYEAFFITGDALEITTEDQTRTYENQVLIVPPKVKHCSFPNNPGSFCLLFSFEDTRKPTARQEKLKARLSQGPCVLPLTPDVEFYIRKVAQKNCRFDSVSQQEKYHLATLLFYELFSRLIPKEHAPLPEEKGNARHIYNIETYINQHRDQKIALEDVANAVSLSQRQVSRIIQKEYGCTLSQLITEKRLSKAERQIITSTIPIDQIAAQSGLGSTNYFYSVFKKRYGVSPLQYRKQHQENKQK